MEELKKSLKSATKDLFSADIEPELTRPEEEFGDFSTNLAMQLAPQLKLPPIEIAQKIAAKIQALEFLSKAEVAGAGFINLWLNDKSLMMMLNTEPEQKLAKQKIVVEYSDPNPFKVLHVGHLYTSVIGDAIAKLQEALGADVHRVNFGGDVGLHVARTMWAVLKSLGGENPQRLDEIPGHRRADWLADNYVLGTAAYGENEDIKKTIIDLNKRIYQIHEADDRSSPLAQIYWTARTWSYDYFEQFYRKIGSGFEKYYPESETVNLGMKAVKDNLSKVFEKSEGAVVYKGEVHNMHTRVFINKHGLPTYETKDVGLILKKWQDYHFDKSIIITGNEIYEYMQVVLKAVEQFAPDLVQKTTHITHGLVKLAATGPKQSRRSGVKMSSREGNIIRAEDVLDTAGIANREANGQDNPDVSLGAVKYAFLKNRIGADIIFDPVESVSLQGNSGPYLQYAYVRARSILQKGNRTQDEGNSNSVLNPKSYVLEKGERTLARKISEYPEVVEAAALEYLPSHACTYLYELAQVFNRFYEKNRVVGDPREGIRRTLVESYANVLKQGLEVLNIPVVERM